MGDNANQTTELTYESVANDIRSYLGNILLRFGYCGVNEV